VYDARRDTESASAEEDVSVRRRTELVAEDGRSDSPPSK
jgi:hypothetical protein